MNAKVIGILVLLLLLCGFMSYAAPNSFSTGNNIENVARRTAMYGILGIGVAFVIITSGIDLSIGSIVCLSGILLAIFLRVDYVPKSERDVLAVKASLKEIYVQPGHGLQAGDRIRYYQGIRARNAILTVQGVDDKSLQLSNGSTVSAVRIQVDRPLSRDDEGGKIARVYPVQAFDMGADDVPAKVAIGGDHVYLGARDQIHFIDAENGRKKKEVELLDSAKLGAGTEFQLKTKVDDSFTQDWLAIPIIRSQRMPILMAIGCVLLIALVLGSIHGLLITKLDLPPFLVTLCGLLIYRGVSRWLVRDQVQGFGNEYESTLSPIATGKFALFGEYTIPYAFFILVIVAIAAAVFLNKTIWGRYMLAVGNNEEAARYSGINTHAITILAYVICTCSAALGGMLFALGSNSISPSSFGNLYELYAIAAAVLGGCSLRGGEGSIVGVVIGTALMQALNNMIVLLKISNELEFAIIGFMILAGVVSDVLIKRLVLLQRAEPVRRVSTYQRIMLCTTIVNAALLGLFLFTRSSETAAYLSTLLLIVAGVINAVIVFLLIRDTHGWRAGVLAGLVAAAPGINLLVGVGAIVLARKYLQAGQPSDAAA